MNIFCDNCGSRIEDDSKFCPDCGNLVINSDVKNPAVNQKNIKLNEKLWDKKTKKSWIIVVCTILAFVLFFCGKEIYLGYKNQNQQIEAIKQQQQITIIQANKATESAQQQTKSVQDELQKIKNQPSAPNLSKIIATWRPIIGHVACAFSGGNILLGSSTLVLPNDGSKKYVITNRHIMDENLSGNFASSCAIKFPLDDTYFLCIQLWYFYK